MDAFHPALAAAFARQDFLPLIRAGMKPEGGFTNEETGPGSVSTITGHAMMSCEMPRAFRYKLSDNEGI